MIRHLQTTIRIYLIAVLTLVFSALTAQKASFTVECNAEQMVGVPYNLTFKLKNGKGTRFNLPKLEDFQVLGGPMQGSSTIYNNGKMTTEQTWTYEISPKKTGRFSIGSASVECNGQTLTTAPFLVNASKSARANNSAQGGNSRQSDAQLQARIANGVLFLAVPERTTTYLGEQLIVDFKICTNINLDHIQIFQYPTFKDISVKEMQNFDANVKLETIGGRRYNTKVLKRIALFPATTGTVTIDEMMAQVGVEVASQSSDDMMGFFSESRLVPYNVSTSPVRITVMPLPDGAPSDFSNSIGHFTANFKIDKQQLSTDEALSLTLTVSGEGDTKSISAPKLNLPVDSFEVYEPKIEEKQDERDGKIYGEKTITYLIVPKKPCHYRLKPRFSWYDTKSRSYEHAAAVNFDLDITQGTQTQTASTNEATIDYSKADIRPLKASAVWFAGSNSPFFASPLFWILSLLPFIGLAAVWFLLRRKDREAATPVSERRRREATTQATTRLAAARQFANEAKSREFHDELSRTLRTFVADKLTLPVGALTTSNVAQVLASKQVASDKIATLQDILSTCDMAIFAGVSSAENFNALLKRAETLIDTW